MAMSRDYSLNIRDGNGDITSYFGYTTKVTTPSLTYRSSNGNVRYIPLEQSESNDKVFIRSNNVVYSPRTSTSIITVNYSWNIFTDLGGSRITFKFVSVTSEYELTENAEISLTALNSYLITPPPTVYGDVTTTLNSYSTSKTVNEIVFNKYVLSDNHPDGVVNPFFAIMGVNVFNKYYSGRSQASGIAGISYTLTPPSGTGSLSLTID